MQLDILSGPVALQLESACELPPDAASEAFRNSITIVSPRRLRS
jgi:hypothetical protein